MRTGRYNVGIGLLTMAGFMLYGFFLIYLRDFHSDRAAWIAGDGNGPHFESRLAHVHGNLFGFLNVVLGFVFARLNTAPPRLVSAAAGLAVAGLLMPIGILTEIYLGVPPILVLVGALAMTVAVALTGGLALRHWNAATEGATH